MVSIWSLMFKLAKDLDRNLNLFLLVKLDKLIIYFLHHFNLA